MGNDTIGYEKIAAMARALPPATRDPLAFHPMLAGIRGIPVYINPSHPQRIARYETKRFAGHPLIRWLARVLPSWATFEPDILVEVPVYEDEPHFLRTPMGLFVSPRQYAMLKDIGA